jgi:hypothetical protein
MSAACRKLTVLTSALLFLTCCVTPPAGKPVGEKPVVEQPPAEASATDTPAAAAVPQEFVATEELKKKTFDEVQAVIVALDKIIADSNYSQWLTFLTKEYVASRGSDAFLVEASGSAVLRKSGIVLRNLEDYFTYVVVRSHSQGTLNEITFVDATHVKAYTNIQGALYILYYLVREDDRWKIGVLPSGGP